VLADEQPSRPAGMHVSTASHRAPRMERGGQGFSCADPRCHTVPRATVLWPRGTGQSTARAYGMDAWVQWGRGHGQPTHRHGPAVQGHRHHSVASVELHRRLAAPVPCPCAAALRTCPAASCAVLPISIGSWAHPQWCVAPIVCVVPVWGLQACPSFALQHASRRLHR